MTTDELKKAVDYISSHDRTESVGVIGDVFLVNAVRRALGKTMKYRKWEDEKANVSSMIDSGMSLPQIADAMGCDKSTICNLCRKWGFESQKKHTEYTKIQEMRMKDLRLKGYPIRIIAEEVHVSEDMCKKKLQRMGVVLTRQQRSMIIASSNKRRRMVHDE